MINMTSDIAQIVECLLNGGVALLPTDTVYGLAVSPLHPDSVDRLFAMKRRPRDLHIPIMVANEKDLESLGVDINANTRKLLESQYFPGALTLALGFKGENHVPWLKGRVEIAVRIPDDARMLSILRETGPLLVTSANIHGRPCGDTIQNILNQLDGKPDIAIDGGELKSVPSTLVNCRVVPPVVEREGCVSSESVMAILR